MIDGRWFRVYIAIWVSLFALAIWCQAIETIRGGTRAELATEAYSRVGITGQGQSGAKIGPSSNSARRAGVRDGDTIVSIDRIRIPPTTVWKSEAIVTPLSGPDGSKTSLVIRSEDGHLKQVILRRDDAAGRGLRGGLSPHRVHLILAFVDIVSTALTFALAGYLCWHRPRDAVVALFTLWVILGNIEPDTMLPGWVDTNPPFYPWLMATLQGLSIACFELSLLLFPSGRSVGWPSRLAILGTALNVAFFVYTSLVPAATAALIGNLIACTTLGLILFVQISNYRHAPSQTVRQQTRWVLFGIAIAVLFFAISVVALEVAFYTRDDAVRAWSDLIGNLANAWTNIAVASGFLIAMLRFRLYDAEAVITRSAGFGLLTVLLGLVFAISEKTIELIGQNQFGQSVGSLSSGLAAGLAAAVVAPTHGRVHAWAEARFRKALVRLRHGLPALVDDLREVVGLGPLLDVTLRRIQEGVHARRLAVVLATDGGYTAVATRDIDAQLVSEWCQSWQGNPATRIECDRRDALFPARLPMHVEGVGHIGWLLLGSRPDGSFFGHDEQRTLVEVTGPVARAIEVVRQRAIWIDSVESRLSQLIAKLR